MALVERSATRSGRCAWSKYRLMRSRRLFEPLNYAVLLSCLFRVHHLLALSGFSLFGPVNYQKIKTFADMSDDVKFIVYDSEGIFFHPWVRRFYIHSLSVKNPSAILLKQLSYLIPCWEHFSWMLYLAWSDTFCSDWSSTHAIKEESFGNEPWVFFKQVMLSCRNGYVCKSLL